jgi:hypothetical protein
MLTPEELLKPSCKVMVMLLLAGSKVPASSLEKEKVFLSEDHEKGVELERGQPPAELTSKLDLMASLKLTEIQLRLLLTPFWPLTGFVETMVGFAHTGAAILLFPLQVPESPSES